jgi:hypothetical protein
MLNPSFRLTLLLSAHTHFLRHGNKDSRMPPFLVQQDALVHAKKPCQVPPTPQRLWKSTCPTDREKAEKTAFETNHPTPGSGKVRAKVLE